MQASGRRAQNMKRHNNKQPGAGDTGSWATKATHGEGVGTWYYPARMGQHRRMGSRALLPSRSSSIQHAVGDPATFTPSFIHP